MSIIVYKCKAKQAQMITKPKGGEATNTHQICANDGLQKHQSILQNLQNAKQKLKIHLV